MIKKKIVYKLFVRSLSEYTLCKLQNLVNKYLSKVYQISRSFLFKDYEIENMVTSYIPQ